MLCNFLSILIGWKFWVAIQKAWKNNRIKFMLLDFYRLVGMKKKPIFTQSRYPKNNHSIFY